MDSKLTKLAAVVLVAGGVMSSVPALAQSKSGESQSAQGSSSQSANASGGQSSPSQVEQRADEGRDWGWIGLLGLLGLAGLRRRRDEGRHETTTAANRGPSVYNR